MYIVFIVWWRCRVMVVTYASTELIRSGNANGGHAPVKGVYPKLGHVLCAHTLPTSFTKGNNSTQYIVV
jgi:hypothetical protein